MWKDEAINFFNNRSVAVMDGEITIEKLCFISGRDSRLWTQELYDDLILNINKQLELGKSQSLLEVGCAAGFLAKGLSKLVSSYTGVDVSSKALDIARRLKLKGCVFDLGDGNQLPYADNTFDRVLCSDVFINIPDFNACEPIIREMLRVVKPGGKVMIGSIPDSEFKSECTEAIARVNEKLTREKGEPINYSLKTHILDRIKAKIFLKPTKGNVQCYYFNKQDFVDYAQRRKIDVEILAIHPLSPYLGYKFNAVYVKPL